MKCSRCKKLIEDSEIRFATEGEVGKPLCRKCKAEVEEESRERYRKGRDSMKTLAPYRTDAYRNFAG